MADMPKELKNGDIVEIVLRGVASNVTHEGKQGPRLTVAAGPVAYANGVYLVDEHVQSVTVVTSAPTPVVSDEYDDGDEDTSDRGLPR